MKRRFLTATMGIMIAVTPAASAGAMEMNGANQASVPMEFTAPAGTEGQQQNMTLPQGQAPGQMNGQNAAGSDMQQPPALPNDQNRNDNGQPPALRRFIRLQTSRCPTLPSPLPVPKL